MAITWTSGRNHISQIALPNPAHKTDASAPVSLIYYIKDAEARDLIAQLAAAGIKFTKATNAATTPEGVTWDNSGTAVTGTLKPTFQAAEAPLPAGFSTGDPRPDIYLVPAKNASGKDIFVEFVVVKINDTPTYAWEQLGDTEINFDNLGALAYADTATGSATLNTVDSASFSNIAVNVTSESYTPAGSIDVTLTQTATDIDITRGDYTPAGSVSKPTITVTPSTDTIYSKKTNGSVTAGSAASYTRGAFSGGSFTQGQDQWTAPELTTTVSGETLTISFNEGSFTPGTDTFTPASHDDDTFTPNDPTVVVLPTFEEKTVATDATAVLDTAPTFTGTKETGLKITAAKYDKATVNTHTFTGTAATIASSGTVSGAVDLTKTSKTITTTVSPDPKA